MAFNVANNSNTDHHRKMLIIQIMCLVWIFLGLGGADCTSSVHENDSDQLSPLFYRRTCRNAVDIVESMVKSEVAKDPRMGASLIRLHFHDCFPTGCDASVLLDDTPTFTGEKTALPNVNSLRGFEVIDAIKAKLEQVCPGVVSCADILTLASRDSVDALGGLGWRVPLGRRDSTTASLSAANSELPPPFFNLSQLITNFANKGFTAQEMVVLSGAHTIGKASCFLFRSRIYNASNIDPTFANSLKSNCPSTGGDLNLAPLDVKTPSKFDNAYFKNLISLKGLLNSDQELYGGKPTDALVEDYADSTLKFFVDFKNAMIKMGNLNPLTGSSGQIRSNCRRINSIN